MLSKPLARRSLGLLRRQARGRTATAGPNISLLAAGNVAQTIPLLKAVAETKTARIQKDRKEAATAYHKAPSPACAIPREPWIRPAWEPRRYPIWRLSWTGSCSDDRRDGDLRRLRLALPGPLWAVACVTMVIQAGSLYSADTARTFSTTFWRCGKRGKSPGVEAQAGCPRQRMRFGR